MHSAVNREVAGSKPATPATFIMKAIIFEYKEDDHETKKLFLHCNDIKQIYINTFYHDMKSITFRTISNEVWIKLYVKNDEVYFFQEIQEFIESDERIKIVKVNRVTKEERNQFKIQCHLLDWISVAVNRNKI
jgi:hypothetical protein